MTKTQTKNQRTKDQTQVQEKVFFFRVSARRRLTCLLLMVLSGFFVFWISLDQPIITSAAGVHIIDIDEPGDYVAFFKGDLRDPYGWDVQHGQFRDALVVDLESYDNSSYVWKIVPFKDLAAANAFSVAEFEVYHPGRYLLYSTWRKDTLKCDGTITLEKNVVEKFFYRWAAGILGGVAFLGFLGFPIGPRPE